MSPAPSSEIGSSAQPEMQVEPVDDAQDPTAPSPAQQSLEEVPFYRKVIAQSQREDPNGFGPNWSNVDDFDIPTVLRKQMD